MSPQAVQRVCLQVHDTVYLACGLHYDARFLVDGELGPTGARESPDLHPENLITLIQPHRSELRLHAYSLVFSDLRRPH